MIRKTVLWLSASALVAAPLPASIAVARTVPAAAPDLADLINPLMGTDSSFELSYGNVYPSITTPWGMNSWSPVTGKPGSGWGYTYEAHKINGIKETHQPSPWMNDYGAFSFFAETGPVKLKPDERASWFSHKAEVAHPYDYKVFLADYDVTAEMAPTDRAAQFEFTFPKSDDAHILIDGLDGGSMVRIEPEKRRITGWVKNNSEGVPGNFRNYFVAQFDHDFTTTRTWDDNWQLADQKDREGGHVGAVVSFRTGDGEKIHVKVASSFISAEQAELNLNSEIGNDSFAQTRAKAKQAWETALGKVRVDDGNIEDQRTFYSSLYRMLQFPRVFYEKDAQGQIVHYSPYDGKVHAGYMYTDNGFWDTWRGVFPFFVMMYPDRDREMMAGLANAVKEGGWLPEWASPGYRDVMVGSDAANIIADAYVNGVRGYDIDTLYKAMVHDATSSEGRPTDGHGNVISAVGREGAEYYNKYGYVPYDVGIHENAARTLEYATNDFSLSRLALAMGKADDAKLYASHALNYRNLYDPSTGWMRGRNQDGSWQTPFNPYAWGDAFTEGNAIHYTWAVMQDPQGLMNLMGGRQKFVDRLDSIFTMPPLFDDKYYGQVIHETREMQIVDMGQYAHGNEPIQHMIYFYDWGGAPWKGQAHIRDTMAKLYSPNPDGYPGDEDNGQTSAWYVWSALGFYPVTPAVGQYAIGSPLFRHVTLTMPTGKTLTIDARNNGPANVYIQSVTFNGKPQDKTFFTHDALQQGGKIEFVMGPTPNRQWGSTPGAAPFSLSAPAQ